MPLTMTTSAIADTQAIDAADVLTPLKYARFLHERIEGSQLVVLPGAGHSLPTEHATLVAGHVAAFLHTLSAPEARS